MARLASILLAGAFLIHGSPSEAQRNEATLDASIFSGTVGYARRLDTGVYAGGEIGFGFPQFDRTIAPSANRSGEPDFEEYLHLAVLVRYAPSPRFEVDAGVRGSIADLWPCSASDCWPAPFVGAYLQPMIGWRRIKLGLRLTAGWIAEDDRDAGGEGWTGLVAMAPFVARCTMPW